jgi:hypothetical protein
MPPRDSNPDMLIQIPNSLTQSQQDTAHNSAESGKVLQNPQPPRNKREEES